ncbi:MAG TPA: acyl carrier protein [Candidatus Nitrosotenuis sp.]|jgi:acyl carrier protein|nr:acyl carrier protein [Candidatus Nitrosotenuis sp.]
MSADVLAPDFLQAVQESLAQVTVEDVGPITAERALADLGLDSVSQMELILVMEDRLNVSIDAQDLESLTTFGDLQSLVARLRGQTP